MIDGKLIRRSFGPDRNAAEAVLSELRRRRAITKAAGQNWTGIHEVIKRNRKVPTFYEIGQEFLEREQAVWAPSTFRFYKDILHCHLYREFGDTKVTAINVGQIAKFRAKLAKRVSPSRTNRILELLRYVLNLCVDEEYIPSNPAYKVKKLPQPKPDINPLRLGELKKVLEHIDSHYRPLYTCLAWTGVRPNELLALRWSDLDFVRKEIRINKGRVRGFEGRLKTPSSYRVIPMLPPVESTLLELQETFNSKPDDYVFTDKKGKPINKHLDRIWKRALESANLKHRPSYQLRHTFASLCLMQGINPGWVSTVLGHSTLEMTFTHYARYIPDEFNQQHKKLAPLWNEKEEIEEKNSSQLITKLITGPILSKNARNEKPHRNWVRRCKRRGNGASEGTRTPECRNHNPVP